VHEIEFLQHALYVYVTEAPSHWAVSTRSVGHGVILQRTHKSCCASQEPELLLAAIVVAFASLVKVVSRPPAQL